MKTKVKRIYEAPHKTDGTRILVDRLWPRGISKAVAQVDYWPKILTPSSALRAWFHQDKAKRYLEFARRYQQELKNNRTEIIASLPEVTDATLVTAVKTEDFEQSHLPTLTHFLNHLSR